MFEKQLDSLPAEPPRRTDLLPGLRFSEAVPRAMLIFVVFFVVIFTIFPLIILSSDPRARLQLGPSRTMAAQVLSVADASPCRDGSSHRVVYEFTPEPGHTVRGKAVLCQNSAYYSIAAGARLDVKYLQSHPEINALTEDGRNNDPPFFLFVFFPMMGLLVFAPLIVPRLREILFARRVFARGRLTSGTVIFVKRRSTPGWPGMYGVSNADVFIEYQRASNQPQEAKAWCSNDWLLSQLAPGAKIHVAYIDDRPDRVVLLEAFIR